MDDGQHKLTFAELHAAVQQRASTLTNAPATVWVDALGGPVSQMVSFLAIIATGRCAAVSDPDWPSSVRQAVQNSLQAATTQVSPPTPNSPFYIGFTSGSTGLPKGFRRHHRSWTESLRVCLDTFGPDAACCVLAPGRFSHSLFLFGMVLGIWSGGGVVVQDKFSASRALQTLEQGQAPCLVAVPSQLLMMLEFAARRDIAPITQVRLILISGARWMRNRTQDLKTLFPHARVVEFYGASETSFMAWMDADETAPAQAVGRPFANVDIDIRQPQTPLGVGQIFVRSPMLFMDYVGPPTDQTAAIRDGEWLSVRDMGYLNEVGLLCLVGRENRMIVTQGKNLFPEELEAVLMAHPHIRQASVHGVPDALRGQQVVAVLELAPECQALNVPQLHAWCRDQLESFKIPKRFFTCTAWPRTASGKTEHATVGLFLDESHPCLQPLL